MQQEPSEHVDECASGFVYDLIDDAVDDFADDLVQDVDDVLPATPSKVPSVRDAQLVLNAGEPAIFEEADEDGTVCAAASVSTDEVDASAPCAKQVDNGTYDSEEATDDPHDGYEEVYSLASEDPLHGEDMDEEIESLAYVKMAAKLAQTAVSRGCTEMSEEVVMEEEARERQKKIHCECSEEDLQRAKAAARDALLNALLGHNAKEEDNW
jgi:hypothetical protein